MSTLAMIASICLSAQGNDVPNDAHEVKPIKTGSKVPNVKLTSASGKPTELSTALNGTPTVLVFYRGGWCPFCNTHLAELGQIADDIRAKGAQIIGISPDTAAELEKSIGKHALSYTLLSDSKGEAMKKFGIAFRVDDETFTMYRDRFNLDLEKASGEKHHYLPVPSVFVVDAKGTITFAHSNPDYKVRLKGKDILAALN